MNSRLQSLVDRGYPKEDVLRLALFTEEELEKACDMAFEHITRNCFRVDHPQAIFIGGQPGCGKTVLSLELKNEIKNIVEIGIDNYRMYHPRYLEIENYIKNFWKNKKESINDTPGNDIADFTHLFAGAMTDKLIERCSKLDENNKSFNMILEWGMREPTGPLKTMTVLKEKKYNNSVIFVATHREVSYDACNLRAEVMKNSGRIIRKVPKNFHDLCIETLPESIDTIYTEGIKNNVIDYMSIITRKGRVMWDIMDKELPGNVYKELLNSNNLKKSNNNPEMSLETNEKEMIGLNKEKELEELEQLRQEIVYYSYFAGIPLKGNIRR